METRLKSARRARGWSQLRLLVELERLPVTQGLPVPSRSSLKTETSRWENGHVSPREPYAAERQEHGRSLSLAAAACGNMDSLTPRVRSRSARATLTLVPADLTASFEHHLTRLG